MSHRTGIRFPAESGPVQTTIEDDSHNPGLGYLSTEMPTWRAAAFNTESARCHWIS